MSRILKIGAMLLFAVAVAAAAWLILKKKETVIREAEPDLSVEIVASSVEKALESSGLGPGHIVEGEKELLRDGKRVWYLRKRTYSISEDQLMRVTISFADLENAGKIKLETSEEAATKAHLISIFAGNMEAWRLRFVISGAKATPKQEGDPIIAVIIDDVGSEENITKKMIELDAAITFSVLPNESYTNQMRGLVKKSGREIMLHLPMEPRRMMSDDPKPGMLWTSMSPTRIRNLLAQDFDAVPEAVGVNNHMGSMFTVWEPGMRIVLEEVKRRGLFYIDSITDPRSIACDLAGQMGVKCEARDVFLDTIATESQVRKQWRRLINISKKRGFALAIGHPRKATYEVLRAGIPRLAGENIRVAPVSEIFETNTKPRITK